MARQQRTSNSIEQLKATISARGGLAKANLYNVTLPRLDGVLSSDFNILCKSMQMPGRQILSHDRKIGMVQTKVPYGFANDDITLSFHVPNDFQIRHYFEDWQRLAINQDTYEAGYYNEYTFPVVLHQLRKGISLPVYKENFGDELDFIPTNILNRLPRFELPGYGGVSVDLGQGDIEVGLLTGDLVMNEVKLLNAFPTTISPITYTDASEEFVEVNVTLTYKDWVTTRNSEFDELNKDGIPTILGRILDKVGIF